MNHHDGGMKELEFRDVDFLKNKFPSMGEKKRDLKLYEFKAS